MKAKKKTWREMRDGNEYADGSTYENPDGKQVKAGYADGSNMKNEQDADAVEADAMRMPIQNMIKSCYESTEKQEKNRTLQVIRAARTGSQHHIKRITI